MEEIRFYKSKDKYYEFTNFWDSPITIDDITYPTSEHYFQSQKFSNHKHIQELIINERSPTKIYKLANSRTGTFKDMIGII